MGTIRVEYIPIKKYNLGLLGLDHLQIVYEDETSFTNTQDNWYVLEGTHDGGLLDGTLGVLGQEIETPLAAANGVNGAQLVEAIGTPESRGSRIVYQGLDALGQWHTMMNYGVDIEEQVYPYEGFSWPYGPGAIINSSSVVATLLYVIGVDVNTTMPLGTRNSPGTSTLLGTPFDDDITIRNNFTQLATGSGDDTLRGSDNAQWPEKFYGMDGDDTVVWSGGENIVHGGGPRIPYALDGLDTADYSGAGRVHIIATRHSVEHKIPQFVAAFDTGSDQLFSIEQIEWFRESDIVTLGQGVDLLEKPVKLELNDDAGGRGDQLGFLESSAPLIINVVDGTTLSVQTVANQGLDAGYWAQSVEWIAGSAGDDLIYAGPSLFGAEGGAGNDLVDGRFAEAFVGGSPQGYDIELFGGDGDDTIVSGAGWTIAEGGAGDDTFVLSSVSTDAGTTEFVITDAGDNDKLYVPYEFFKLQRGEFEGADLLQITGAPFTFQGENGVTLFEWGLPDNNAVEGFIEFVGSIGFQMDGGDLLISIMQGHPRESVNAGDPGEPDTIITRVVSDLETLTFVRVIDWQPGDLGISFDLTFDDAVFADAGNLANYPGFEDAVRSAVSADKFLDALDLRPESYLPQDLVAANTPPPTARGFAAMAAGPVAGATEGDDVIAMTSGGPYVINGLGGNDTLTGSSGGDVIDGGTGGDIMTGGRGNDTYFADSADDVIVEFDRGGFDTVYAAIDYVLGSHLEHLTLTGRAVHGTGNALRNTLVGNSLDNILISGDGDDTLAGNLGDDTLQGGDGGDGYVWERGDGHDVIIENAGDTGQDVIVIASGTGPGDITFVRDPAQPADLILRFASGGSMTIQDYFATAGGTIEAIEFVSGPVWDGATLEALAAQALVTGNFAPVANDDAYAYSRGTTLHLPFAALLDNDFDEDGDSLSITGIASILEGSALISDGEIIISAGGGDVPRAVFDYIVSDGQGGHATARAEIDFVANAPPVITSATLSQVFEDTIAQGTIAAADPDGETLVYAVKQGGGPSKGSIVLAADGTFTFTPRAHANGADSLTVQVTDDAGVTRERTIAFEIVAVNDAPTALDDSGYTVAHNGTLTITHASLLANDSDIDGDSLSLVSISAASSGRIVMGPGGVLYYAAAAGYAGPASFNYSVSDGHGGLTTATATLTVKAQVSKGVRLEGTDGADVLTGTELDDVITGKGGNDVLTGLGGTDVFKINGDDGLDTIDGGAGYDVIRGGASADVLNVLTGLSNVKGIQEIDGGLGSDTIKASAGGDTLDFSRLILKNIELIDLGNGNDSVIGSAADDWYAGGQGRDIFIFRPGAGHDTITDFDATFSVTSGDQIDLRAFAFSSYDQLRAQMTELSGDVRITLDASTTLTLADLTLAALSNASFRIA